MVLGLTIAEIILLLLFALLLALAASLYKLNRKFDENAVIASVFRDAVSTFDTGSSGEVQTRIKKIVDDGVALERAYQKKAKELESKLIPDRLNEELIIKKVDLNSKEGRETFFSLMTTASKIQAEALKSKYGVDSLASKACEVGAEVMQRQGPEVRAASILTQLDDLRRQVKYWQGRASSLGKGGTLPNCYALADGGPFVYLYKADILREGIMLSSMIPDSLADRFRGDFANPPPLNRIMADAEFLKVTRQFLDYGERQGCRFSIRSKDLTSDNTPRYKRGMAVLGDNFYPNPVDEDKR